MMNSLFIILLSGYISFAPALEQVIDYRTTKPTQYPLEANNIAYYDCYAGLPYGYGYLIGSEIFFIEAQTLIIYGPILVVDVEQKKHKGMMKERLLAADVFCKDKDLTHKLGLIVLYSEIY